MTPRPNGRIPDDVSSFIAANLRSIDDLQLLVVVVNFADHWWDTQAIAREVRLELREAQEVLTRFVVANLLEIRLTDQPRYRFRPGTLTLHKTVNACLAAFEAHSISVIRLIYGVAREGDEDSDGSWSDDRYHSAHNR
jgi:hypothetical protein